MIERHTYDSAYAPIPDSSRGSMLDVARLPNEVQDALSVVRDYEAQGAIYPTLLADPVRAWFRWRERREARAAASSPGSHPTPEEGTDG